MTLLEKIYDLSPEQSQVLRSEMIGDQLIEVREYENYRWLQIGGDSIQGLMDVDFPSQILLPNIQALLATLLFCPKPKQLLNLGFGCGSIERFCIDQLPDVEITSLETSVSVIQLAEAFFFIGEGCQIVNDSAETFLANENKIYDIILCDIFNDEEHPACLYDDSFYKNLLNCLDDKGVLAINLLPESEGDVLDILLPMKNYFDNISLLEVPNHFNAILFASNFRLPETDELVTLANKCLDQTGLDLRDLPQRLNRLMEMMSA
ncbi:MAG: spermidine synthase [marine bacterium B5-7]|nr:MAG: spermidine synthase [marine bacterium B5-7]